MNWIVTHHGRRVDLPTPQPGQVKIDDIATHLARLPRFAGATSTLRSVAGHSLHVCDLALRAGASLGGQLAALLHDAHEAYCADIPHPFKAAVAQARNQTTGCALIITEHELQREVLLQLGALTAMRAWSDHVRHWDLVSLATERQDLMHPNAQLDTWPVLNGIEPDKQRIHGDPYDWYGMAHMFRMRFDQLASAILAEQDDTV